MICHLSLIEKGKVNTKQGLDPEKKMLISTCNDRMIVDMLFCKRRFCNDYRITIHFCMYWLVCSSNYTWGKFGQTNCEASVRGVW